MNALPLLLALACSAPAQFTAPAAPASVYSLAESFNEAYETPIKTGFLESLSKTQPVSARDIEALYNLFSHYSEPGVRQAVMSSLDLMDPQALYLEPVFVALLRQPEPEAVLIGIRGALRLHAPAALPIIEKLAKKKLKMTDPSQTVIITERNEWWNHYEALDALAQWKPDEARPILLARSRQSPRLARLLAKNYWPEIVPMLTRWMTGDEQDEARAQEALSEDVPLPELRAATSQMLQVVRDPHAPRELRHQLAIKMGLGCQESDVAALLKEYDGAADPTLKLLLEAALFASRSPQIAPLLLTYAKQNPQPQARAAARVELKELLAPPQYRDMVAWASKSDPDPQNRQDAAKELAQLDKPAPTAAQTTAQ